MKKTKNENHFHVMFLSMQMHLTKAQYLCFEVDANMIKLKVIYWSEEDIYQARKMQQS